MNNEEFDTIVKQKCIALFPLSNIIILEDLSVWEIQSFNVDYKDAETNEIVIMKENVFVKLPIKAEINFADYYGDDGKANWFNPTVPISIDTIDNIPTWVY